MYLVGDIGGTKTNLALFSGKETVREKKYPSGEHKSLDEIVKAFLSEGSDRVTVASFGIAGPIEKERVETTNLPWIIDAKELGRKIGTDQVYLLNDLEANAYGIRALKPDEVCILNKGTEKPGNAALISAGTGLGEAGLYWDGNDYHPFACEGGHSDFAPRDELEIELLRYLQKKYGHVSFERVVSGPAIHELYQFLVDTGKEEHTDEVEQAFQKNDPSKVISQMGVSGESKICVKVLEWFISLYGSESGNMALKFLSFSAVYVGGGIAPKILDKMKENHFMDGFTDKGRFKEHLEQVPVKVILNDRTALLGAAEYAMLKGGK